MMRGVNSDEISLVRWAVWKGVSYLCGPGCGSTNPIALTEEVECYVWWYSLRPLRLCLVESLETGKMGAKYIFFTSGAHVSPNYSHFNLQVCRNPTHSRLPLPLSSATALHAAKPTVAWRHVSALHAASWLCSTTASHFTYRLGAKVNDVTQPFCGKGALCHTPVHQYIHIDFFAVALDCTNTHTHLHIQERCQSSSTAGCTGVELCSLSVTGIEALAHIGS